MLRIMALKIAMIVHGTNQFGSRGEYLRGYILSFNRTVPQLSTGASIALVISMFIGFIFSYRKNCQLFEWEGIILGYFFFFASSFSSTG